MWLYVGGVGVALLLIVELPLVVLLRIVGCGGWIDVEVMGTVLFQFQSAGSGA